MTFVFQTIEELEVRPTHFDEFEVLIKSSYELYELKYSAFGENVNYEEEIEKLFKGHSTMSMIIAKMESKFPLTTQDVITQDAIVIFVPEIEYSSKFMITGGIFNLNDNTNTSLVNESITTEDELKTMNVNWKVENLISFGNNRKELMNGFISWHMWIKEIYNDTLVMDYKTLANEQRHKKTEFIEKIYDDLFSKLKIKRFYLSSRKVFVQQEITKTKIIKLLMSVMTAKT